MSAPVNNNNLSSLGIRMLSETAALGQSAEIRTTRLSGPGRVRPSQDAITLQFAAAAGGSSSRRLRAVSEGISVAQSGNATLTAMAGTALRMRELAVSAAGDTLSDSERVGLQAELTPLLEQLGTLAAQAEYGGRKTLDGDFSQSVVLEDGPRTLGLADLRAEALGLEGLALANADDARAGIRLLDAALDRIYRQRAAVRAFSEQLEQWVGAAESRREAAAGPPIRQASDAERALVDGVSRMAAEPGRAMRAQGNLTAGGVLQLLR